MSDLIRAIIGAGLLCTVGALTAFIGTGWLVNMKRETTTKVVTSLVIIGVGLLTFIVGLVYLAIEVF